MSNYGFIQSNNFTFNYIVTYITENRIHVHSLVFPKSRLFLGKNKLMTFYDYLKIIKNVLNTKNIKIIKNIWASLYLGLFECIGKGVAPSLDDLEDDEDSCSLRRSAQVDVGWQLCSISGESRNLLWLKNS